MATGSGLPFVALCSFPILLAKPAFPTRLEPDKVGIGHRVCTRENSRRGKSVSWRGHLVATVVRSAIKRILQMKQYSNDLGFPDQLACSRRPAASAGTKATGDRGNVF